MKALDVCPSTLQEGHRTYSPAARKTLFDGRNVSHVFSEPSPDTDADEVNDAIRSMGRISLSGVQSKFSVVIGDNDRLRYAREKEQGAFILKPTPIGYQIVNRDFCAANEHVTMQIASQVYGIETAANALCFFDNGMPAYITRRFDVHGGGKYKQEDFAALLGYSKDNAGANYKYDRASYEECAGIIHRYVKAALIDVRRFFRLILFNFVTLNDDAHLKNFSLIERGGEYRLSPAYDLVNTSLQLRTIGRADFEEFGKRIGLPEKVVRQEVDMFTSGRSSVRELLRRSFLSAELQEQYWKSYDFRCKMLAF